MDLKVYNMIENSTIALGVVFGITNIESILGIVLLVLQVALIIWKLGYKVYLRIKYKQLDKIQDDIEKAMGELEQIKNNQPKEEDKNGK